MLVSFGVPEYFFLYIFCIAFSGTVDIPRGKNLVQQHNDRGMIGVKNLLVTK